VKRALNEFVIKEQIGGLNDYQNACRSHWSKGSKFKKEIEETIGWYIRIALSKGTLTPVSYPIDIVFEWHEKAQKRDTDNIQSGQKFIIDAMRSHGVIVNDNRKYVKQTYHQIIDGSKEDFVIVKLYEAGQVKLILPTDE
jgi:Holliday junction resolvase RusA-like endonuclease